MFLQTRLETCPLLTQLWHRQIFYEQLVFLFDNHRYPWRASHHVLKNEGGRIQLTRKGFLNADALLPVFFEEEHQGIRYT